MGIFHGKLLVYQRVDLFQEILSIPQSPCSIPASPKGSCRTPPLCPPPPLPPWQTPRPATLHGGLRHLVSKSHEGGAPKIAKSVNITPITIVYR